MGIDVFQQRQRGVQQARIAGYSPGDKGQRPAAKDLLNQRGLNVHHPVAKPLLGPCLAVMDFIGVQNHRPTGEAVLEAAAIVKALYAGERLANGVSIMPVRLITVAAEEGFDTLNMRGRLGQADPIRTFLLWHVIYAPARH